MLFAGILCNFQGFFSLERFSDHKQTTPALIAIFLDAGLEGEVAVAHVNFMEKVVGIQGLTGRQVCEIAVRAVGRNRLIFEDLGDHEHFDGFRAMKNVDLLADLEIEEFLPGQIIVCEQADCPVLGGHAKLRNCIVFIGDKAAVCLLDYGQGELIFDVNTGCDDPVWLVSRIVVPVVS